MTGSKFQDLFAHEISEQSWEIARICYVKAELFEIIIISVWSRVKQINAAMQYLQWQSGIYHDFFEHVCSWVGF